ncbi:hypothetical protein FB45DRAFT_750865 [Roridomyces roridus]|uniref:BTB domain-containing protein n=1 Tax=Roridomyces roridus TaxID=1738132 RepID=A0AAD7BMZ2_9AGAR|nr:hypothetical protein FB45DRAFT_750865 [Roridomyces roridus]
MSYVLGHVYPEGSLATIQVEDEIYKVPRYHFEKGSEIHADAFKLPPTQTAEGQSDESPVKLDGIKSVDFERLLAALYPLNFNVTISMPKEHWISVLKLSTMWYMREARELAIEHLDGYVRNTAEGIVLARMYHVAQWLRSGYQALARSPYLSLSPADTHLLGWETVENQLFKVPGYRFENHSEVFKTASELPVPGSAEGQSDEDPIKLGGVSSVDFERFLSVLYPSNLNKFASLPKDHLISVLKLATLWRILDVRDFAIDNMDRHVTGTAEGIFLGRTYHVAKWLRSGYYALARSPGSTLIFSEVDLQLIGWDTVVKLYRVREQAVHQHLQELPGRGYNYYHYDSDSIYANADVEGVFTEELKRAEADAAEYSQSSTK